MGMAFTRYHYIWPAQGTLLKEQFEETDYQRQSQDKDVITQGGVEQNCLM